jgi:hypothetical protein
VGKIGSSALTKGVKSKKPSKGSNHRKLMVLFNLQRNVEMGEFYQKNLDLSIL